MCVYGGILKMNRLMDRTNIGFHSKTVGVTS